MKIYRMQKLTKFDSVPFGDKWQDTKHLQHMQPSIQNKYTINMSNNYGLYTDSVFFQS